MTSSLASELSGLGFTSVSGEASSAPTAATVRPQVDLFFGSQSGTADALSHDLALDARLNGFDVVVHDMQTYDRSKFGDVKLAVFVVATYGHGEPTDNAVDFFKWINDAQREKTGLKGLKYGVFGLGDSQYGDFCVMGQELDERLNALGAKRLLPDGKGDADSTLESDFLSWKAAFWPQAKSAFGVKSEGLVPAPFQPSIDLAWANGEAASTYVGGVTVNTCDAKYKPLVATVLLNRELRDDVPEGATINEEGRSTRHIDLDISGQGQRYNTADNLGVCPGNDSAAVARLAQRLKVDLKALFHVKERQGVKQPQPPLASTCSVEDALTWHVDFQATPRPGILTLLAEYTRDPAEQAQLREWASSTGYIDFRADARSLLEVLEDLPGIDVPFDVLLSTAPRLRPRYFTISSSALARPTQVSLTVSLTSSRRPRGRTQLGVASSFLHSLEAGQRVAVFVRPSDFRLPTHAAASTATDAASLSPLPPILMIASGTGIAPFRAFVEESEYLTRTTGRPPFAATHLFFGCRHPSKDFLYRSELKTAVSNSSLTQLHTAFSRERPSEPPVYVQHQLQSFGDQLWSLLSDQRAFIYVCGSVRMGRQVKQAMLNVIANQGGKRSKAEVMAFIKGIKRDRRIVTELWG